MSRVFWALAIGGSLIVGVLTGGVFALLSEAGWDEGSPGTNFLIGFLGGTIVTFVSGVLSQRRRR